MNVESREAEIRQRIKYFFEQIWREDNAGEPPPLKDEMVLLESGLDSMSYAILLARLEDELGFDPFQNADEVRYPRSFGELVVFYGSALPPDVLHAK